MECVQLVDRDNLYFKQFIDLRHRMLRAPLGLSLYDEDLREEMNQFVFVGIKEGIVLTCLLLQNWEAGVLKLRQMATEESLHGFGYGRQLVLYAEEWARKHGYTHIVLHARLSALGFYKKLGYEIIGESFLEVGIPHFNMKKVIV